MEGKKSEVEVAKEAYEQCHGKLQNLHNMMRSVSDSMRRSELTLQELERLDNSTPTYKSVGRIFLKAPINEIKEDLVYAYTKSKEKSTTLEAQRPRLETDFKTSLEHYQTLVRQ